MLKKRSGPNLQSTETGRSDVMKAAQIGKRLSAFWSDQDGVTAIEYALLAALIFGAIVISVGLLGDSLKTLYDDVAQKVADATS